MAATTITKNQLNEVQVAIAEKIKFLKELANDLDEIGSHQEAEDMRHSVDDLNDAYQKSIHFDEWKVEK